MSKPLNIGYDSDLLASISAEFNLRKPNHRALRQLALTLDDGYDPSQMQVLNLATGVGKTYLMAAFVEYLRQQGVGNVVIVTPGKTVQHKTVQNFTQGSPRYIAGSAVPPDVVTPQDYSQWVTRQNSAAQLTIETDAPALAFIFNIQQLIAPSEAEGQTHAGTQDSIRRKPRRFDENAGVLFDYLKELDDLVVIADESHLYSSSAAAFNAALKELDPALTVGLTASASKTDEVIFAYPLYQAIQDKYVKAPVLAFRKDGYGEDTESEEQQLRDALQLRAIKQRHYDTYAETHHRDRLNAVAFVVCSDVDHATQVTQLLRSPEYLGRDNAVLQVDSKHEDEATLSRLENLDHPDSPVLTVVSVNKLKEGWDVRNIAVVVTLRAMASEVLTQQTMGRGLRLPFGEYTDIWQIDQLDIISHRSFKELLSAENVLLQFGLEQAVEESARATVESTIKTAAQNLVDDHSPQPSTTPVSEPALPATEPTAGPAGMPVVTGGPDVSTGIGVRILEEDASDPEGVLEDFEPVVITRNERFADVSYLFPVTSMALSQAQLDLSAIDDPVLKQAAKRVVSSGDVLHRKAIIAALGKELRVGDAESAEVSSKAIDDADVASALLRLVMNMQLVPKTAESKRYAESYLVPRFINDAPLESWTVKALDSALDELQRVLIEKANEVQRKVTEVATTHPKLMPGNGHSLPLGEQIHEPVDSRSEFVRGRVYSGWFKSLFEAESFDSYSGEYCLARLLNTSPNIAWWHRLHRQDNAYIYFNAKDRYFPDFVAYDRDGTYWIIEGKDARGRDDQTVKAKREAAESAVRRLRADPNYADQTWGYLIAYEDDIAKAESWDDLKAKSQPISNAV